GRVRRTGGVRRSTEPITSSFLTSRRPRKTAMPIPTPMTARPTIATSTWPAGCARMPAVVRCCCPALDVLLPAITVMAVTASAVYTSTRPAATMRSPAPSRPPWALTPVTATNNCQSAIAIRPTMTTTRIATPPGWRWSSLNAPDWSPSAPLPRAISSASQATARWNTPYAANPARTTARNAVLRPTRRARTPTDWVADMAWRCPDHRRKKRSARPATSRRVGGGASGPDGTLGNREWFSPARRGFVRHGRCVRRRRDGACRGAQGEESRLHLRGTRRDHLYRCRVYAAWAHRKRPQRVSRRGPDLDDLSRPPRGRSRLDVHAPADRRRLGRGTRPEPAGVEVHPLGHDRGRALRSGFAVGRARPAGRQRDLGHGGAGGRQGVR